MVLPGKVAVLGGGSWATALAKMILENCREINWYMRRQDRIDDFCRHGHNPAYLSSVSFDTSRITFFSSLDEVAVNSDTLVFATPSPYLKQHLTRLTTDISGKFIVSAIKGIVPEENKVVSGYFADHYGISPERIVAIGGPSHAEEVALERLCYLTFACDDIENAQIAARLFSTHYVRTTVSADAKGIEYAGVLKNVYAIAAGICYGLKSGDNFQSILVSNAIREMERFLNAACPAEGRDIDRSAYLGDLLVTAYSRFSRNHMLGNFIGCGYSVKSSLDEMEMIAEGYYGAKCTKEINSSVGVHMPILDSVYSVLYQGVPATRAISELTKELD